MTFIAETHALVGVGPITLTVPAGVQGQDVMTVFVSMNDALAGVTAGWAQVDAESSFPAYIALRKVAAGSAGSASSDVGATVTVSPAGGANKTAAVMVVERGVDVNDSPPVHGFQGYSGIASGTTTFAGPAVTTTVDGCEILSVFMDKDSIGTTLTATPPAGYTTRSSAIPTTGTGKTSVVAATKTGGAAGNYGADTWTLNGTPGAVGIFTIALKPAVTTQTVFPTSDVASTSVTGVGDAAHLYANIDDAAILTDYDEFLQASDLTVGLNSLTDPGVDTGFVVFYTLGRGASTTSVTWTITLKQGTTSIESWTETVTGDGTSLTHSISSTNAANIVFTAGVASNLRLEFAATTVS